MKHLEKREGLILSLICSTFIGSFAYGGPNINVNPGTTHFGDVQVGATSDEEIITISNIGDSDLHISRIVKRGADADDYNVTSTTCSFSGMTLSPGNSCEIHVTFSPGSTGYKKALFKIISDAENEPKAYAYLRGTGVNPEAEINPTDIDFGEVWMPGDSSDQNVTVTNTGDAPLTINNVVLRGVEANNFRILSDSCSSSVLDPGSSCSITVDFKPQTIGRLKAALKVYTEDVDNTKIYTHLQGIGRNTNEPDISSDKNLIDFGDTPFGDGCGCPFEILTVQNAGGNVPTGLKIDKVVLRGRDSADYNIVVDNCTGSILNSGDSCTIEVEFCPSSTGFKKAVIKIRSNDPDETPYYVKLRGTGVDDICIAF